MSDSSSSLRLSSSAFSEGGSMDSRYTCEGPDISPDLSWIGAPANTKSFALMMWIIPTHPIRKRPKWSTCIGFSTTSSQRTTARGQQIRSSSRRRPGDERLEEAAVWRPLSANRASPVPKLFALDSELSGLGAATKPELLKAMEDHILAHTELVATYTKNRSEKVARCAGARSLEDCDSNYFDTPSNCGTSDHLSHTTSIPPVHRQHLLPSIAARQSRQSRSRCSCSRGRAQERLTASSRESAFSSNSAALIRSGSRPLYQQSRR